MKLYRYTCGDYEKFAVAANDQDAYDRRSKVDPTFHYIPVTVEEMKVDGYEISIQRIAGDSLETMNRDQLKQWLSEKGIEFVAQWGETKLRELALQHA